MRAIVFVAALFIAGCAGQSTQQIVFNSWAAACESYATSLIALAPAVADGRIAEGSDADLTIKDAEALVGPNCRDGEALPDLSGRPTQIIQDILLRLQGLGT